MTFSSAFRSLVPSWLLEGDGEPLLGVVAQMLDESVAHMRSALTAQFPTFAVDTTGAVERLGYDRGIWRGRGESDEAYALRLTRWRYPYGHRTRGSAYGLLEQVSQVFGGVRCQAFQGGGALMFSRAADGTESKVSIGLEGAALLPSYHFFLGIDASAIAREHVQLGWEQVIDAEPGDVAIGQKGIGPAEATALRYLFDGPVPWHPCGTVPRWAYVTLRGYLPGDAAPEGQSTFADTFADTFGTAAVEQPESPFLDMTSDRWGERDDVNDTYTCVRRPSWYRYFALSVDVCQYEGTPGDYGRFPGVLSLTGNIQGRPDSWPSLITLIATYPPGRFYQGDPAKGFAASICLPDDGTII